MTTRELQSALNRYAKAHGLPLKPLDEDNELGPATRERIGVIKLCLGYKPKFATAELTKAFRRRLVQWKHPELYRPGMIVRGAQFRKALRKGHSGPRAKALHWLETHRGLTEQPSGSNCDQRQDGIRAAQDRCANGGTWLRHQPWCGVWVYNALLAAGVKGISSRQASVALIEQDAKAGRGPFISWSTDPRTAKPGDVAVYFGMGVHTGVIREVQRGLVLSEEGNTSFEGRSGSQSDGGASALRHRPFGAIRGVAHVRYP